MHSNLIYLIISFILILIEDYRDGHINNWDKLIYYQNSN